MHKIKTLVLAISLLNVTAIGIADDTIENFPSGSNNTQLYYNIGGGRSVPIPATDDDINLPIDVNGDIGLGFSCGKFNPIATITNSLNDFKDSIQNVSQSIISNATSAAISFPMYKVAQADPKLYNIINNNVLGAHSQFSMQMKSCEEMQSEALKGQNPYNNFISISRNSNMKDQMQNGDGDLNKSMAKVNSDQGKHGVPWATPGTTLGTNAGGQNQPLIMVVNDTAIAGYNVIVGENRTPTDPSTPSQSDSNKNLLNYWATPQDAAKWIVSVIGDQKIATCTDSGCPQKTSVPGTGLLPYIQQSTVDIDKKLANLVANPSDVNEDTLMEVSAPGQVVSPSLLENIRQMNGNAQSNTVSTLSQNIATTRIVNEALLAIDILQTGSEVPNIQSVGTAQTILSNKIDVLQNDIDHIMRSVNIRKELDSHVMSNIMEYTSEQNAQAAAIPQVGDKTATLSDGGIVKQDQ